MADATYIPKIQHSNNGDTLTVASGGTFNLESGSTFQWKDAAATPVLYSVHNVTTAEVNAGHELLPATAGRTYRILYWGVTARGAAATTVTSVDLQDTNSSPVSIAAIPVAALTQDETCDSGKVNVVGGAGGGGALLTADKGVRIIKNGTDMAGATSLDVVLMYTY